MTKRVEEFDFEATCRALAGLAEKSSPEDQDALEIAAYALHFLYVADQMKSFRDYLRDVKEPASSSDQVAHDFPDMAQALAWLQGTPAPAQETRVRVAGRTYAVWSEAGGLRLVPVVSPRDVEA